MSRIVPMTANFPGLVRLLAEHLYPERSVFVREMIQNAHDSLVRRRDREPGHAGRIDIELDEAGGRISFADDGTGMTAEEVVKYLTVLGESGTDEHRRRMADEGRAGVESLIGQFGIGLLSGFLVADRIEVVTRCVGGDPPVRWTYDGGAESSLESGADAPAAPGTRVTLHVKHEYRHYLQPGVVQSHVVRFADFLPVPVHLNGGPAPINIQHAPWHRSWAVDEIRDREYARFILRRFEDTPLEVIPVDLREPYRIQGVLFLSDRRIPDASTAGALDLYCKRMFVRSGDTQVLPPWAKFVRGLIESPELTITASRSDIQRETRAFQGIQDALAGLLLDHLRGIAERNPRHFQKIMRWHHYHVRGAALAHDEFFRAVADLVPFETSAGGSEALLTLPQVLARQGEVEPGKGALYYFAELGAGAQFNEMCAARGIVVVNASYAFDERFLRKYAEWSAGRVDLRRLDEGGGRWLFDPPSEGEADAFQALIRELHRTLNQGGGRSVRAQAERFRPTDLPLVVTLPENSEVRRRLADLQHHPVLGDTLAGYAMEVAGQIPEEPLVLHVNVLNPTLQRLAAMTLDEELRALLVALYNNATLLSNQLQSEGNLKTLYRQTVHLVDALIASRTERQRLEGELERARAAALACAPMPLPAPGLAETLRERLEPDTLAAVLRAYPTADALLADGEVEFVRKTGLDAAVWAAVRARLARGKGGR